MRLTLWWSAPAFCLAALVSCQSNTDESASAAPEEPTPEQFASMKRNVLEGAFASSVGIGARAVEPSGSAAMIEEPAPKVEILESAAGAAEEGSAEALASGEYDLQELLDDSAAAVLTVCMDALETSFQQSVSADPDHPFTVKLDRALEPAESVEFTSGDELVTANVGIQGEELQMIYSPAALAAFEAGESAERPALVMGDGSLIFGGTIDRSLGRVEFFSGCLAFDGGQMQIAEGTELSFDSVPYVHDGEQWVLKTE